MEREQSVIAHLAHGDGPADGEDEVRLVWQRQAVSTPEHTHSRAQAAGQVLKPGIAEHLRVQQASREVC